MEEMRERRKNMRRKNTRKKVRSERKEAVRGHSVQFRVWFAFSFWLLLKGLFSLPSFPLLERLKGEHFFPEKRRKERRRKEGKKEKIRKEGRKEGER